MASLQAEAEAISEAEATVEEIVDEFGRQRSHEASKIAYDLCKVTAQSCLLINGGAATAVLALLAKDSVSPNILKYVPWALGGYAVGVATSAIMMFCIMMMADNWNYYWYNWSYLGAYDDARKSEREANGWHWAFYAVFVVAMLLFLASSGLVAIGVTNSNPAWLNFLTT